MSREKAKQDIVISLIFYALVGYVSFLTGKLKSPDSRMFPYVILALILFLSTLLLLRAAAALLKTPVQQNKTPGTSGFNKVLWFPYLGFAGIVFYIFLFEYTNYLIASAVLIMAFMLINKVRPWWLIAAVAGGYLLFTYVLFIQLLKVRLI